ncbi:hypothetical protein WME98_29790 [Sorangium sp. So ce296]|uniref:hypothetical protein n=1 Tax=Sorangium sp. So ce296 TaxID=3133296 RepID=UPI003F5FCD7E
MVIWSTPAYLEFCVSPCILYADEPAVIEQALLWIQANHPELSIERSEAARWLIERRHRRPSLFLPPQTVE